MNRSRIAVVALLLVSLIAVGASRALVQRQRASTIASSGAGGANLGNLNSFTLGLLLGGLRGPLVMVLWSSSESQKSQHNLEDFDTKVELIRLLQPEFDTVHLFQIWNKAYNVSHQLATLSNKYLAILDAIDYGYGVLRQRPNNLSMHYAIGGVFAEKLADAPTDKEYYRRRVRQDTMPGGPVQVEDRDNPYWRRLKLDTYVDAQGNILPQYLEPTRERPADLPADAQWNNGALLQYLEPYQPFPYGISPVALGYNHFMKAKVLLETQNQKHAQIADNMIARRPAVALWQWAREEMDYARRLEMEALDLAPNADFQARELTTAQVPLTRSADPNAIEEAIAAYDRAVQVINEAVDAYQRFFASGRYTLQPFEPQLADMRLLEQTSKADRAFLRAMRASGSEKVELARVARVEYRQNLRQHYIMLLKYYTPPNVANRVMPTGLSRDDLEQSNLSVEEIGQIAGLAMRYALEGERYIGGGDELRAKALTMTQRAASRLVVVEDYLRQPTAAIE